MRFVQFVLLTIILAFPDDVLSRKKKEDKNGPCGKNYLRQINGKCFYFASKKMNWYGAQNNCLRKGLNLADLSTPNEFNAVVEFLKTRGNMEDFWFGGNDLQTEGRFTYIHSGRPVEYLGGIERIESTQRSNLDDCLEIRLRNNATTVTDDNCDEIQFFICAQNAGKCAQPSEENLGGGKHSHEHLHHFHHDPAKDEVEKAEKSRESIESDSRPADNSNSTEIGDSQEIEKNPHEGGQETGLAENSLETGGDLDAAVEEVPDGAAEAPNETAVSPEDRSEPLDVTTEATAETGESPDGAAETADETTNAPDDTAVSTDDNDTTPTIELDETAITPTEEAQAEDRTAAPEEIGEDTAPAEPAPEETEAAPADEETEPAPAEKETEPAAAEEKTEPAPAEEEAPAGRAPIALGSVEVAKEPPIKVVNAKTAAATEGTVKASNQGTPSGLTILS